MSATEFTAAMTRLLVDCDLRQSYRRDPLSVAQQLDVAAESWLPFVNLDPDQLDRQAECLVAKRRYEVRVLIPGTIERMAPDDYRAHFDRYAKSAWPQGAKRHLLDACQFLKYLIENESTAAVDSELHWLQFLANGHKFQVKWVNHLEINGHVHCGVQVFYRLGGGPAWRFYKWPLGKRTQQSK